MTFGSSRVTTRSFVVYRTSGEVAYVSQPETALLCSRAWLDGDNGSNSSRIADAFDSFKALFRIDCILTLTNGSGGTLTVRVTDLLSPIVGIANYSMT